MVTSADQVADPLERRAATSPRASASKSSTSGSWPTSYTGRRTELPRKKDRCSLEFVLEETMAIHDWTRVDAGLFDDSHQDWTIELGRLLNAGRLPPGYAALTDRQTAGPIPDVLTVWWWTCSRPRTATRKAFTRQSAGSTR